MGQVLYTVVLKKSGGSEFRVPTQKDLDAAKQAEMAILEKKALWIKENLIPFESIPEGSKTGELLNYGISTWDQAFSPRQLFSEIIFLES